jgi:DNA-directed RNA polymerase specialized sigma24 family protein
MRHVESTPRPPPPTAGSWQAEAVRLAGLVAWHVTRLCRANNVPPADREDVVAEALVNLCVSVKSAFARGVTAVNCRYYAQNGLAAAVHTHRGRPLRLLADAVADPEGALASRGPGPDAEAEAAELLPALLARLPERLRRVVALRAAGLSVAEVARRENVCVRRVRQLLLRARAVLLGR